jgi:hypothetical protein
MKTTKKGLFLAAFLLFTVPSIAGIFCFQLKNCAGTAGCDSGSVEGCEIECLGGGSAFCITIEVV